MRASARISSVPMSVTCWTVPTARHTGHVQSVCPGLNVICRVGLLAGARRGRFVVFLCRDWLFLLALMVCALRSVQVGVPTESDHKPGFSSQILGRPPERITVAMTDYWDRHERCARRGIYAPDAEVVSRSS